MSEEQSHFQSRPPPEEVPQAVTKDIDELFFINSKTKTSLGDAEKGAVEKSVQH